MPDGRPRRSATQTNQFIHVNVNVMFSSLTPVLLLLIGLSSCSIARHGAVPVPDARINWPPPTHAGRPQPGLNALIRRDGTHSTHNDKHTNKAARAHRLTGNDGIRVGYPQPGLIHRASYKTPGAGLLPVGGVVIDHRPNTAFVGINYKMPRPVALTGLTPSGMVSKPSSAKPFETLNRLQSPATLPAHAPINPID